MKYGKQALAAQKQERLAFYAPARTRQMEND